MIVKDLIAILSKVDENCDIRIDADEGGRFIEDACTVALYQEGFIRISAFGLERDEKKGKCQIL